MPTGRMYDDDMFILANVLSERDQGSARSRVRIRLCHPANAQELPVQSRGPLSRPLGPEATTVYNRPAEFATDNESAGTAPLATSLRESQRWT
jgi:hypothetical protein